MPTVSVVVAVAAIALSAASQMPVATEQPATEQPTAEQSSSCPMHVQHQEAGDHRAGVNERGNHAMGFDHQKTTHHFRLFADGGAIEVEANNPADKESRDQIRMHLKHIAGAFSEGNFDLPMFIHDQVPPGVPRMKDSRKEIQYLYQETERGARVRISSKSRKAIGAVHEFLQFQIKDHQTGDSGEVEPPRE